MSRSILRPIFALAISLAGLGLVLGGCENKSASPSSPKTIVSGQAKIGGPFQLINQDGKPVTDQDFIGKPQLIYFGYASCPDVCPTSLQKMARALEMAGMTKRDITPIFISVDPQRDTPEILKAYVTAPAFPTGLVGLTGTNEQLKTAQQAFKVYAAKAANTPDGEDSKNGEDYAVDHSNFIYFMDENGKFIDIFGSHSTPAEIAAQLKAYTRRP